MSSSAERRFLTLRKRLDQLGYKQPLGIETLPLVEKLFSDLVHTTESLRNAKLSAGKPEKESSSLDLALEPYRADNARLVRENNELHLDLLKLREHKEQQTREMKALIRRLNHETTDLKFLNNQYVLKVRSLEKESKSKSEKIQQLQEKNTQAVVQTPGGKKRAIPFRRQRMLVDELVPPSLSPVLPEALPSDPYIADLLQVADGRIQELQHDVSKLKLELDRAEEGILLLNTQVEERDREIERLGRALDGGRPHDVVSLEAQNTSNEKLIAHLNLQIEHLQEANALLKHQLEDHKHTLNGEMKQELSHIEQVAKQLQEEKDLLLETADQELLEAKGEVQRQHAVIAELETLLNHLRKDLSAVECDKQKLMRQIAEMEVQNEKLNGQMNFTEEEKKRLQDKVDKLMDEEKELVLELERRRARFGICAKDRSPSRLDAFVRSLEEERDFYRLEAERQRTGAQGRGRSVKDTQLQDVLHERDELQALLQSVEKHMQEIQTSVQVLTSERDSLQQQLLQAQQKLQQADVSLDTAERDSQLRLQEKDLKSRGVEAEKITELKTEASALRLLQERTEETLSECRHQLSVKKSEFEAAQQRITEQERRMVELSEQSCTQQQQLLMLQKTISALDQEKDSLQDQVDQKTEAIVLLQEKLNSKETSLTDARSSVADMEKSQQHLQVSLGVCEREVGSLRRQLDGVQEERASVLREREITLRENRRLQDDLATMTRENQAVRVEMEEAMCEKDELKLRIHTYITEVARVESLMAVKEQENRDVLDRFRAAHAQVGECEVKLEQAECVNSSIRLELLSADSERRQLRERVANLEREMQEHLSALQAYELQASGLGRSLSSLEAEVKEADAHKAAALSDLNSVRELCVRLDSSKELVTRQLCSKNMELERVNAELEDVRAEVEVLRKQLSSEKRAVMDLEELLSTHRQKDFQMHVSVQSKDAEITHLLEKLNKADSKMLAYTKDVSQLQNKVSQLQTEMEVLKRQLTNERFERERATQEIRRQQTSSDKNVSFKD